MVSRVRLRQCHVLGYGALHRLMRADRVVGPARREDVRAARDRVPGDARAVHATHVPPREASASRTCGCTSRSQKVTTSRPDTTLTGATRPGVRGATVGGSSAEGVQVAAP